MHLEPATFEEIPNNTMYCDLFSDLDNLEHLEFSVSTLKDEWPVRYPKNIKTLILDYNLYSELDVHWCEKIEELSVANNLLNNIPKLHDPPPPLKILRLKFNPMNDLRIMHIAQLCKLAVLELEFKEGDYYYDSAYNETVYCDCFAIVLWLKEMKITGSAKFSCGKPKGTMGIEN